MTAVNCERLPKELQRGVGLLAANGFLKQSEKGAAVTAAPSACIRIEKRGRNIHIAYDTPPHFYMALARALVMDPGEYTIRPRIGELGLMLDCSRNAVMLPHRVGELICMMALAGYTYLELYTEDTYELPGEPYFGYKRGRYTEKEIKEIAGYAAVFGITVVPCIQTLSHLSHLASWEPYKDLMQDKATLKPGDENVYSLIRKCLIRSRQLYGTDRINIGMDEAPVGREDYIRHAARVLELCREEGLRPELWSDVFFSCGDDDATLRDLFDGTQTPIYWEYYETDPAVYRRAFDRIMKIAGRVSYAGCLHKHMSVAPDNGLSRRVMDTAFDAAIGCGVSDILMTAWGDHGNECSIWAVLPSMWYAACLLYPSPAEHDRLLAAYTGYDSSEWQLLDDINYIVRSGDKISNAGVWALYNDLLIGMMDRHIRDTADEHYRALYRKLDPLSRRRGRFALIFRFYSGLCSLLSQKATFSKRLYQAYGKGDRQMLGMLKDELPALARRIDVFRRLFLRLWMNDNKGFGFEVIDLRLGGMRARCQTAQTLLEDYLSGRLARICELEEERLPYWAGSLKEEESFAPWFFLWDKSFTENDIL